MGTAWCLSSREIPEYVTDDTGGQGRPDFTGDIV